MNTQPNLTIGIPVCGDYAGLYATLQALRLYHDLNNVELLVVDNNQEQSKLVEKLCGRIGAKYIHHYNGGGSALAKNKVFDSASGLWVLCIDSHVFLYPGVISKIQEYIKNNPDSIDLLQGPIVYDELSETSYSTHWNPVWSNGMFGTWGKDEAKYLSGQPFEIQMQGCGLMLMRKQAWPKFNPLFTGFGAEEGYIQEKVRRRGGSALCIPWLKWVHRFDNDVPKTYRNVYQDRFFNYLIGRQEFDLPTTDVIAHFKQFMPEQELLGIVLKSQMYSAKDGSYNAKVAAQQAIYKKPCINLGVVVDRANCNCPGKFVYSCELHQKCRPFTKLGDDIRCCQDCPDYTD